MSQENEKLVLEVFSVIEHRNPQRPDRRRLIDLCHPEIEFHWPASLPYGGMRRGFASSGPSWEKIWSPLQPTEAERRMDPRVVASSGDEVVVAVKASGVCHSDLHIWEGGFDLGGGRRLTLKDRGIALPLTLGHETAGEIVSVGPHVTDREPGEMCLVQQDAHQLGDTKSGMSVIELNGDLVRQRMPIVIGASKAADDVGERAGDKEILLTKAQSAAGLGRIIGIKHAREVLGHDLVVHGAEKVAVIEFAEIEIVR